MPTTHQLLYVQGGGKGTHDEWDNKLVDSLRDGLGKDYELRYPRMPREDEPSYARWKPALEQELAALQEGAILVGHSVGATMLVHLLASRPPSRQLAALFLLAAPFVGDGGWPADELTLPADLGARLPRGLSIHCYHGSEDETAPVSHLELYARAIPQAKIQRLPGRDHQLNNDLSEVAAAILALTRRGRGVHPRGNGD